MNSQKSFSFIIGLFVSVLFLQGCSSYDPVSVSKCAGVVRHAKKTLGKMAPNRSKMMADCKKATDNERGCIMAATTKMQVSKCL